MALRRAAGTFVPKLWQQSQAFAPVCNSFASQLHILANEPQNSSPYDLFRSNWRSFASDVTKVSEEPTSCTKLSRTPSHNITYDEHHHIRYPPSQDQRSFAYLVLTGGRFMFASAIRLAVLKFVVSLSAAADTLALASLEVDLANINEGETVTVKWRGKPVFIRHRTDEEIAEANKVNLGELRHAEEDSARAIDPKYLVVVGVCTHLGCVPISDAGDYNGWFCPCHGSHYDISGRIRKGPAPYNLEVPEYRFIEDKKIIVG